MDDWAKVAKMLSTCTRRWTLIYINLHKRALTIRTTVQPTTAFMTANADYVTLLEISQICMI
jgi:hypothetical protein